MRLLEPGSLVELSTEKLAATGSQVKNALARGNLVAMPLDKEICERFFADVRLSTQEGHAAAPVPIVPVFCGPLSPSGNGQYPQAIRVVFGEAVASGASVEEIRVDILKLGDWVRQNDDGLDTHAHH